MSFDPDTLKPRRPQVVVVIKTETDGDNGAPLAHEITVQQNLQIEQDTPEPSSAVLPVDITEQVLEDTTERGVEEERQAELALQLEPETGVIFEHTS
jgi:hypothetical protein